MHLSRNVAAGTDAESDVDGLDEMCSILRLKEFRAVGVCHVGIDFRVKASFMSSKSSSATKVNLASGKM